MRYGRREPGSRRLKLLTVNRYIARKVFLFYGGILPQYSGSLGQVWEPGSHLISSTLNIRASDECYQGVSCCDYTIWRSSWKCCMAISSKVGTHPSALLPSTRTRRGNRGALTLVVCEDDPRQSVGPGFGKARAPDSALRHHGQTPEGLGLCLSRALQASRPLAG
jgi:hypothetical protein